MPTGTILPVEGTPFDFRESKDIGRDIGVDCPQLRNGKGYDHNFILQGEKGEKLAAILYSPETGIEMTVRTTMPGVQFYSGNVLDGPVGKSGIAYEKIWGCVWKRSTSPMQCHVPISLLRYCGKANLMHRIRHLLFVVNKINSSVSILAEIANKRRSQKDPSILNR